MSLVVAQVTENGPRIVSDTRVTFLDERRPSFKADVLKTIVVSREIAISFAGDVDAGLGAVRAFARQVNAGADFEDLIQELLRITTTHHGNVEFIVARASPDSRLTRVRSSGIESDLLTTWIGDVRAFEKFQSIRNRPPDPNFERISALLTPSQRVGSSLSDAMHAVIADPAVESVDDFCVPVAASSGAFNYSPSMFIHVGRNIQVRNGDDLISKMAQPIAEGGYAVSIVEPVRPGTPALGLNFPRARLGMLYLPLEFDEAQVVRDVAASDFAKVIREQFGVELCMPMLREASVKQ